MSERASAQRWTCEIRMRGGRLPDLAALSRHLTEMRVGATLRGVEATVEGRLLAGRGELVLLAAGTGERLRLASLRRKIQWDAVFDRAQPITEEERGAFDRLRSHSPSVTRVRVVGPLAAAAGDGLVTLEVRHFARLP